MEGWGIEIKCILCINTAAWISFATLKSYRYTSSAKPIPLPAIAFLMFWASLSTAAVLLNHGCYQLSPKTAKCTGLIHFPPAFLLHFWTEHDITEILPESVNKIHSTALQKEDKVRSLKSNCYLKWPCHCYTQNRSSERISEMLTNLAAQCNFGVSLTLHLRSWNVALKIGHPTHTIRMQRLCRHIITELSGQSIGNRPDGSHYLPLRTTVFCTLLYSLAPLSGQLSKARLCTWEVMKWLSKTVPCSPALHKLKLLSKIAFVIEICYRYVHEPQVRNKGIKS